MRQLCGGNIYAIEKLLAFGKELRTLYKESKREAETKNNEANEKLMKVCTRIYCNFCFISALQLLC